MDVLTPSILFAYLLFTKGTDDMEIRQIFFT